MIKATPGTVIRATHRPQDLVPTFIEFLLRHGVNRNPLSLPLPDDDHDWWLSDDCHWLLHEDLLGSMEELAPHGHYFGAHPGDGSDFGYWMDEDTGYTNWPGMTNGDLSDRLREVIAQMTGDTGYNDRCVEALQEAATRLEEWGDEEK
ncbi:hypothetical protein HNR62_000322 [Oceanisphaera litoralis]|uniref:hypothetical protein n=1 Tax=Oceanisphaera litoralis TaxID=225144 RepID=UPI0019565346|nr:hypothetical protein [Oceanisphaera litoralis]MBM7454493.1 hypothetical protein [Oceanisphaera litoralis]